MYIILGSKKGRKCPEFLFKVFFHAFYNRLTLLTFFAQFGSILTEPSCTFTCVVSTRGIPDLVANTTILAVTLLPKY
jgi:hypothetical protein